MKRAHILAFEIEDAAEGRYICCNETKSMVDIMEHMREKYGNFNLPTKDLTSYIGSWLTWGVSFLKPSGVGQFIRTNLGRYPRIDNSKIKKDFNFQFTPIWKSIDGFYFFLKKNFNFLFLIYFITSIYYGILQMLVMI